MKPSARHMEPSPARLESILCHYNNVDHVELPAPVVADPTHFSSWLRLLRATARAHHFIAACIIGVRGVSHNFVLPQRNPSTVGSRTSLLRPLDVNSLALAELHVLRQSQRNTFDNELQCLLRGRTILSKSRILDLSPALNQDGLLCVRGRTTAVTDVENHAIRPIILDGRDPAVRLLITHVHKKFAHGSAEIIVNELRQRYWILSIRNSVRSIMYRGQFCKLVRDKPFQPPMGDLPEARLSHHRRPFTFVGLDYFGPIQIMVRRRQEKRWVALFTCMTTRAIHLEVVHSLSADAAIMCLRRFAARRGTPSQIFSDNGTAFVGANRQLRTLYQEDVIDYASNAQIKWSFIPPSAPFMGGAWERLVRSVKTALRVTLRERTPSEEVFTTLLVEAEAIVNARPLTHVPPDATDAEALTPTHFLLGSSSGQPFPAEVTDSDLCSRSGWRRAPRLADHFWRRWVTEYLPTLAPRRTRGSSRPEIKVGDPVLIADGDLPRGTWPRGVISGIFPGRDGIVRVVDVRTAAGTLRRPLKKVQRTTEASRNGTAFAWSAWGTWSACSRTCGGGVAVQQRQCLPRDPSRMRRSRKRRKLVRSTERLRRAREIPYGDPNCPGLAKRYHECNTSPCPGPIRDSRAEQCAAYDRRPFRGRFYTWVPYVDGDSPCTLNCRPRGQQFYASLALAADGTPCTKPGFRAICVQGSCKVVGREGVLGSPGVREVRCGRRLVSGLFSRPRLPLGYSFVATVPTGACRLNISEIVASDNYIALKVTNGSYIMNGEFAVSAPGTYDAAGARFVYSRAAGLDSVFAHGPIHHPIDIMILYTQPNPNIKYEYLTDSEPDETSNDIPTAIPPPHHQPQRHHRHHSAESHTRALDHNLEPARSLNNNQNTFDQSHIDSNVIGERRFTWKILSFTPCSRNCGGGLQIGKFRCVENDGKEDREVSAVHCTGAPPPTRRRRCGQVPCPPRWRAAPWGSCPVCGPAYRTRIVGCVQDHARGITKISDQKCPLPMPPSSELCNIPNCDGTMTTEARRPDAKRQVRPRDRVDTFHDGPVITAARNVSDNEVTPLLNQQFSHAGAGGWLYTEWSECVGWCVGGGVQSRGVRCAEPAGCAAHRSPTAAQSCSIRKQCDAQWFTGEWSPCSAPCGGRQVRGVICIGGNGRRLRDGSCRAPKPESEQACGGDCAPSWYLSDWSECTGPCESGMQSRTVWCARGGAEGAGGAARDADCRSARPPARRSCVPARCSTRPVVKPSVIPPAVSDPQQRVTRHQSPNSQNNKDPRSFSNGQCVDKLSNCALAVQARLCHYPYYADYCCRSCHGR